MAKVSDYYAILGISSQATPEEIKRAYHKKAKQAHPDAGGSLAAMQAVNEAYRVLSSPLERRDYDQKHQKQPAGQRQHSNAGRPAPASASTRSEPHRSGRQSVHQPEPTIATPPPVYTPASAYAATQAERHNRSYARWSVWRFIQEHGLISLAAVAATVLLAPQDLSDQARRLIELAGFVPFYGFAVCLMFLLRPHYLVEIHFAFTRQFGHARGALFTVLGIVLAAIPCMLGWLWLLGAMRQGY